MNIVELGQFDEDLFELNIDIFKEKYPELFSQYEGQLGDFSYDEIEDLIPDNDSMLSLIVKKESISLRLPNNSIQVIYNTNILSWFSGYVDGYSIKTDSKFVYFIIYSPIGQAGALGIWDTNKNDWSFNYYDEGFCVESVFYFDVLDVFIGYYEWNIPMSPKHGEKFFMVDKNRSYKEVEVEKIYDASCCTNSDVDHLDSYVPLNMDMKSQFLSNTDMWLIVDIKQKLAVINDNKQKKILSAYKLKLISIV